MGYEIKTMELLENAAHVAVLLDAKRFNREHQAEGRFKLVLDGYELAFSYAERQL